MEHVIRQTLIARRISELLGFEESESAAVTSRGCSPAVPISPAHRRNRHPAGFSITGGNRNDVTQLIPHLDGVPAVRWPRRRPTC
jgi:hypothetical protein